MKKLFSLVVFLCSVWVLSAQELLTPNVAIEIALKNNFDILLAQNITQITANNNTKGNAGMLPDINLNVSENLSNNTINQKFANGLEVQRRGVGSNNLNANVSLNWVLFDGMGMFANKQRLEELELQSGFTLKEQIQKTVAQVLTEYYALVSMKMQVQTTQKALALIQKRLEIIKTKYEIGTLSAFELNLITIDLTGALSNLLLQQNTLQNQKALFNALLGRDVTIDFEVENTVPADTAFVATSLQNTNIVGANFSLLSAEKNISIAKLQYQQTKAQKLPLINLNSAYGLNRQTSQAGFALLNQSNGFSAGLTASVPIFRGNSINNRLKTSKLQIQTEQLQYQQQKSNTSYQYQQAFNNYTTYTTIITYQKNNALLALANLNIAEERLAQGLSGLLEVKEADSNWQTAEALLIDARYRQKVAEIELKQLAGKLVK